MIENSLNDFEIENSDFGLRRNSDCCIEFGGKCKKLEDKDHLMIEKHIKESKPHSFFILMLKKMRSESTTTKTSGLIMSIVWLIIKKRSNFADTRKRKKRLSSIPEDPDRATAKEKAASSFTPTKEQNPASFSLGPITDKKKIGGGQPKGNDNLLYLQSPEKKFDQIIYSICKIRKGIEVSNMEPVLLTKTLNYRRLDSIGSPLPVNERKPSEKLEKDDDLVLVYEDDNQKPLSIPRAISVMSDMVNPEDHEEKADHLDTSIMPLDTNHLKPEQDSYNNANDFKPMSEEGSKSSRKLGVASYSKDILLQKKSSERSQVRLPTMITNLGRSRLKSQFYLPHPDVERPKRSSHLLDLSPRAPCDSMKKGESIEKTPLTKEENVDKLETLRNKDSLKISVSQPSPKLRDFIPNNLVSTKQFLLPLESPSSYTYSGRKKGIQSSRNTDNPYLSRVKISEADSASFMFARKGSLKKGFVIKSK